MTIEQADAVLARVLARYTPIDPTNGRPIYNPMGVRVERIEDLPVFKEKK